MTEETKPLLSVQQKESCRDKSSLLHSPPPPESIPLSNDSTNNMVEDILEYIGFGPFQWVTFILVGTTYLTLQLDAMSLAFIYIGLSQEWQLDGVMFAITPALTCITNMIGEALFGYMTDLLGRIWPYACSAIILGSFITASAFSPNYTVFAILRSLASLGLGGFLPIAHLTLMEFLPARLRGSVTMLTGVIQFIGGVAGVGAAWWLIPSYPKNGWRYYSILIGGPPFIIIILRLLFHVESPRFLVSKGKLDKAWKSFSIMAAFNHKDLSQFVTYNKFLTRLSCEQPSSIANKLPLLFKIKFILKPPYLRRTILLMSIFAIHGPTFYGSMLFFPTLLKNLGQSPYFVSCVGQVAILLGMFLLYIIMEWPEFGRKNSARLFIGLSASFFFLFAFVQNQITIPVFTMLIFFSSGSLYVFLIIYSSESYPTEIRATVLSLLTIGGSLTAVAAPFLSGYLADLSVHYSWLSPTVWGSLFAIEFVISLFLNHETRQKCLQDMIQIK